MEPRDIDSTRITGRPTAVRYSPAMQDGELAADVAAHRVLYLDDGTAGVHTPFGVRYAQGGEWIVRDCHGYLFVTVDK